MQIITNLQDILKQKGYSVLQFSKEAEISAYKVYKWFDKKGSPKHEDVQKINNWLRKFQIVPHETSYVLEDDGNGNTYSASKDGNYKEKYIQLLEQQNAFLQKTFETSLADISLTQSILMAQVRGSMKREAERFVKEDPVKLEEELMRINKHVGEYLGARSEKGTPVGS